MTPILRDLKTTGGGEPAGAPDLFTNRNAGRRPRKKEMAGSQHKLLKRLETDKEIQANPSRSLWPAWPDLTQP